MHCMVFQWETAVWLNLSLNSKERSQSRGFNKNNWKQSLNGGSWRMAERAENTGLVSYIPVPY